MTLSEDERQKIMTRLDALNNSITFYREKEQYYGYDNPDAEQEENYTRLLRGAYSEKYELEQRLKNG
jgi:hypothetical protein